MKLKFFENIYYWFWKFIPKLKGANTPPERACMIVSLFKGLNILFLMSLFSAILGENLFFIFLGESKSIIILSCIVLVFLLTWNDEKKYVARHNQILTKINQLTPKSRQKKMIIFIVYITLSLAELFGLAPILMKYYL